MPCDTRTRLPNQTLAERKTEVREAISRLAAALAAGKVKPVIGAQGAIAFPGAVELQNARVTDNCAYRVLMATGSALAKQAIAKAEALAGRGVNRQAMAQGHHGHSDGHGGVSWHHGH